MHTIESQPPLKKGRGRRPSPKQTQETEEAILAAAAELFLAKGFAQTRMDEIARRADVAKGTLYLYYPTKAAMFEAVLRKVIGGPILHLSEICPAEEESVQSFLRRTLLPVLRAGKSLQREDLFRLIVSEATRFPELAAIYRRVALDPIVEFLKELAVCAARNGELRSSSDALERFPMFLMTPLLMSSVWNGLHDDDQKISAADAFEGLLELIFRDEQGR